MPYASVNVETSQVPYTNLVIAIPHAVGTPHDFDWSVDEEVAAFRDRFTDWETDKLFSAKMDNVAIVSCPMSRIDVDAERLEDETDRICNFVHISGTKQPLVPSWINWRLAQWFKYRAELMLAAAKGDRPLILDCHSFPCDLAPDVDICIGFNEDASKPSPEIIHEVTNIFQKAGYSVAHNRPFANAIAPFGYCGHSLMIEVNKRCYLDADELRIGAGFASLRSTIESMYMTLFQADRRPDCKQTKEQDDDGDLTMTKKPRGTTRNYKHQ